MSKDEGSVLRVDSRKRISLGDLAQHQYYLASLEGDGIIVLIPAVLVQRTLLQREGPE